MTPEQRAEGERKRAELVIAINPADQADARAGVLAIMIMGYPTTGGEASAAARGEMYRDALEDLPAWAIREAVRLWNRHACGRDNNYNFAPAPAILRSVTENVLAPYRRALERIDAVLDAKTLERAMDPTPLERKKSLVPNLRVMR